MSGNGHWAEREKIINNGKRNASVTDKVIDAIIALQPPETLEGSYLLYLFVKQETCFGTFGRKAKQ